MEIIYSNIDDAVAFAKRNNKSIILYPNWTVVADKIKEYIDSKYDHVEFAEINFKSDTDILAIKKMIDDSRTKYVVVITEIDDSKSFECRKKLYDVFDRTSIYDVYTKVDLNRDRRIETLRLSAESISSQRLEGEVAELGVYKGEFSRYINMYFPGKKLYLFDTFESFTSNKYISKNDERFVNDVILKISKKPTDIVEDILYTFPEKKNCVVCKGYFPETTKNLENVRFCFVNIDVDIYQTTYDGLVYFYPRLVTQGIIFVHDYNTHSCCGVRKAVDEFCSKHKIGFACVPDKCGTIIITKNIG